MSIIPLQLQELYSDVRPNKNDLDALFLRSVNYMGSSVDHLHSLFRQLPKIFPKTGADAITFTTIMIIDVFRKTIESLFWIVFAFGLGVAVAFYLIYLMFFWMPFSDLEL